MLIFDIPVLLVTGALNFFLLLFQLITGLRLVKVKFGIHKTTGIVLFVVATLHAFFAVLAS